jgi:hypothetical protein
MLLRALILCTRLRATSLRRRLPSAIVYTSAISFTFAFVYTSRRLQLCRRLQLYTRLRTAYVRRRLPSAVVYTSTPVYTSALVYSAAVISPLCHHHRPHLLHVFTFTPFTALRRILYTLLQHQLLNHCHQPQCRCRPSSTIISPPRKVASFTNRGH